MWSVVALRGKNSCPLEFYAKPNKHRVRFMTFGSSMGRKHYGLPSLTGLVAFEAAARNMNFSKAAGELNVTTGAISRQIKQLESELGAPLFVRRNGTHLELTAEAQTLLTAVSNGFRFMSDGVKVFRDTRGRSSITVGCTDAFASCWLMPRMPGFWQENPISSVNHLVSDSLVDLHRSEVDICIVPVAPRNATEQDMLLFDDVLYPVTGSRLYNISGTIAPGALNEWPLLHMDWADPDWCDWNAYHTLLGAPYKAKPGSRFGRYSMLLSAAESGQGIALGWHRLVASKLDQRQLFRVSEISTPAPLSYYVRFPKSRSLPSLAQNFLTWLLEEAQAAPAEMSGP